MSRLYACVISGNAKKDGSALLSVAQEFSFGIEVIEDGILFDISGLETLIGDPRHIAGLIEHQMAASGVTGSVAVANTLHTAIMLARQGGRPGHADASGKFAQLSLRELEIDADALNIFNDLGVHNIQDLRQIPATQLIDRYGQKFKEVIDIIEQKGTRLLTPNIKEDRVDWTYELDFPVEDFEQLIFIINHGLDKLFAHLSYIGLSTQLIDVSFELQKKEKKSYKIQTSFPTLEKSFWLKLINLRVSLDPPHAAIESITAVAHFTKPRPTQRGLYAVSRPEPESLLLTINKLKKLVGDGNVGVPALIDQRLAEPFFLNADKIPNGDEGVELVSQDLVMAFNYFRPPAPAHVTIKDKRLLHVKTAFFSGSVESYSGVWRGSSQWWNDSWQIQEWDIEVGGFGVYRLGNAGDKWFLVGEYD